MPDGVVGGLLRNPQQLLLAFGWERTWLADQVELTAGRSGGPDAFTELLQSHGKPWAFKGRRSQIPDLDSRHLKGCVHLLANLPNQRDSFFGVGSNLFRDAVKLKRNARQVLQQS